MKTVNDILNLAWKDLMIILRDKGLLAVIFLLPLLFGFMLSTLNDSAASSNRIGSSGFSLKVYLVNQDGGEYGKAVENALAKISVLDVEKLDGNDALDRADRGVAEGKKVAAIVIPPDFSRKLGDHSPSEVQLLVNPAQENFAGLTRGLINFAVAPAVLESEIRFGIRNLISNVPVYDQLTVEQRAGLEAQTLGVIMTQLQRIAQQPLIGVTVNHLARNPDLPINFTNLIMPAFLVMFAFFLVGEMSSSIFREKDQGTYRRLMAGPISNRTIIAGKMVAFSVMVLLQVVVLFGISAGFFRMDLGDSPLGLLLVTVALGLVVTGMGMLIAAISRTAKQADNTGTVLAFILAGLGGCIHIGGLTPLPLQEHALATVARFTPQGQALMGYYRVISQGGGVMEVLPHVGILLGMAAVFYLLAVWRFRWER